MISSNASLSVSLFGKRKTQPEPTPAFIPKPKLQITPKTNEPVSLFTRTKIEPVVIPIAPSSPPKPRPALNVTQSIINLLDEFIVRQLNADMVSELLRELQNPHRPCHVFVMLGCSGSGKSTIVQYLAKQLKITCHVFDDFVDHGNAKEKTRQHPCSGAMIDALLQDRHPAMFVMDHWTPRHEPYLQDLIKEYAELQAHAKGLNKTLFLLLPNLDNFTMREWVRTLEAPKYYLASYLNYKDAQWLWQMINNRLPKSYATIPDPIKLFNGDFRRLGMDLAQGCNNTLCESSNVFQMTQHLIAWPHLFLRRPLQCVETQSLTKMVVHNFALNQPTTKTPAKHFNDVNQLDDLSAAISDYDIINMDGVIKSKRKPSEANTAEDSEGLWVTSQGARYPLVETESLPLYALCNTMYRINSQMGNTYRTFIKPEFPKHHSKWQPDKSCIDHVYTDDEIRRLFPDKWDATYEHMCSHGRKSSGVVCMSK